MTAEKIHVARHKTAVKRVDFSRPIKLALDDGIITPDTDVFDYGCGRGDDLKGLAARGIRCSGWDPALRTAGVPVPADVVNIGYVVNVIEDQEERAQALAAAWDLARKVLIVAGRTTYEAPSVPGRPFADGFCTQLGTFQKFYEQHQLRSWIEATLNVTTVTAGIGVFYVFRDTALCQAHIASRYQRSSAPAPRVRRSEQLLGQHKEFFDRLSSFLSVKGRPPAEPEIGFSDELRAALGSLGRAVAILQRSLGQETLESAREERTEDLLVYIALSRFQSRPKFTDLPRDLQIDIRTFFGGYAHACELADVVLFSVGKRDVLDRAFRESSVGKRMPTALYVHVSALPALPPLLRVYEGCARMYVGRAEDANIVKLHRDRPAISYLSYPTFEREAHPPLSWALHVPFDSFRPERREYTAVQNPPILHRKEEFVATDHPKHKLFQRLTRDEETHGLYANPSAIGNRDGWAGALCDAGVSIRGHRVVKVR